MDIATVVNVKPVLLDDLEDETVQSESSMQAGEVLDSMAPALDSLNASFPPVIPESCSKISSTSRSLTVDRPTLETGGISNSRTSDRPTTVTGGLSNSNAIAMSLHRAKREARLRSMRLRIPTVFSGTIFTLVALLLIAVAEPYSVGDVAAAWFAGIGVFVASLGFLPSDRVAIPGAVICIYVPIACLYNATILMQVLERKDNIGDDKCIYEHQDSVPCWYAVFVIVLRVVDSIPGGVMIVRLLFAIGRRVRSATLLSIIWSSLAWLYVSHGTTTFTKSIVSFVGAQIAVAVPALFMSLPFIFGGLLHIFKPAFRFEVQSWFMSRGEAVGTAAAVAELLGGRSIKHAITLAHTHFSCIRADLVTKEAMADNLPNPTLAGLTEKARLGFVDAFFSHSWHDNAEAKWQVLQDYRSEFKMKHSREPRLWIDKYCIDQKNIEESVAALPVYLSGCQRLVILCGDTYLRRLWCLIEIFAFLEMGGCYDNLDIYTLGDVDGFHPTLKDFKVTSARCFDPEDEARLRSVIEVNEDGIELIIQSAFKHQAEKCAMQRLTSLSHSEEREGGLQTPSHVRLSGLATTLQSCLAEEVQPILVPLGPPPAWLPRVGVGQRHVSPEMWALNVNQWLSFISACKDTQTWKVLASSNRHIDMYNVCKNFVEPWCRNTGNSVALLMNPIPSKAELMVSHSWSEDVDECGEAISNFCLQNCIPKTTYMFFCTFSMYQPDDDHIDGLSIQDQLYLDPFKAVIRMRPSFGMIVVHTTTADVYTRMWCVYEIDEALAANVTVRGVMSAAFMNKYSTRHVADMLIDLRTEAARCGRKSDEDEIREAIQGKGGFARLDAVILQFRRDMFRDSSLSFQN